MIESAFMVELRFDCDANDSPAVVRRAFDPRQTLSWRGTRQSAHFDRSGSQMGYPADAGTLPLQGAPILTTDISCFHCGLPVPAARRVGAGAEAEHQYCCAGCEAVSRSIVDSGLGDYYRLRDEAAGPTGPRQVERATFDAAANNQRYLTG